MRTAIRVRIFSAGRVVATEYFEYLTDAQQFADGKRREVFGTDEISMNAPVPAGAVVHTDVPDANQE